ncbi:restriction endonuclease subunit S [Nocardia sp. CA-128927]|uniref:restriction endonuclease subunit S n=1 Tax=Nocardia sp. CA-128927 TaxID=3239975 RepID=UPI003D976DE0
MSHQRVKYQYRVIDTRAGIRQLPLMAVSIHHGVVRRDSLTDDLPRAEDLSNYKVCSAGDIVLNRMRAFQGAIGISPERGLVSPDYLVLRPNADVDSGYLHHVFKSTWFVGEMTSRLRGIGNIESGAVRTPRINPEDLGDISIPIPPLGEQRRIADFLDTIVAQIDQMCDARRAQRAILEERRRSIIDNRIDNLKPARCIRLGYLSIVQSGITVDANRKVDKDSIYYPYLRVANVQEGYVDLTELSTIAIPRAMARSSRLRNGDVLMTEGGDLDKLGRGTVWRGEVDNCLHQNHVFAVRPRRDIVIPDYLAMLTGSSFARIYFESTGNKTTNLASTSSSKIRDFRIPVPDLNTQRTTFAEAEAEQSYVHQLARELDRQLAVLVERRQGLITAAVTGQLDATTARPSLS